MAMAYGNVFVGQVAMGANQAHTIKTIRAAEAYKGTSIIIAYSHCIAHGINMLHGYDLQKQAVECGYWPLYHFDPRDTEQPFHLDSRKPKGDYRDFAMQQARFAMLSRSKPEQAEHLLTLARQDIAKRWQFYDQLASVSRAANGEGADKKGGVA